MKNRYNSYATIKNMKGGVRANGYTIVELLIFLAVSSVLTVAVITSFNGRQGRSTFTDGMRDIQSKLDDTVNDVETGYSAQDSFGCEYNGGSAVDVGATPVAQGTNVDCAFMGRIAVLTDPTKLDFYSVFGRSFLDDIEDLPQDYNEAALAAVTTPETFELPNGIELVRTTGGGVGGDPDAVGAYVDLSQYGGDTGGSGEHSASQSAILFATPSYSGAGSLQQASDEVVLCFQSGTSNQFATLTLGGTGGLPGLVTTLQILESTCA